jgi:phospholipase C
MVDSVKRIILLLLENRSFDHVLGCLKQVYPALDGIDRSAPQSNSYSGHEYQQTPAPAPFLKFDPRHEHEDVVVQLAGGTNSGFVSDYAQSYPRAQPNDLAEIMKYHDLGTLPAIHQLAQNFTICDHWYSSVPGPTWCNRLFALSGTSLGHVEMPEGIMNLNLHWYDQETIFDRLNEKAIKWKVYFGDFPLSLLFVHQWEAHNSARYRPMTEFFRDVTLYDPHSVPSDDGLPPFSLIEPSYCPPNANDAHPPHDLLAADAFVASVYNTVRSNEKLWNEVLLVIGFDEHGGFYDHVSPPETVQPDYHHDEYSFTHLGVRVPVVLVSPWVDKAVFPGKLDHTNLLKYMIEKWGLAPLGHRTSTAGTFSPTLLRTPRGAGTTPASVLGPQTPHPVDPPRLTVLNNHLNSLVALSHVLESMAGEEPAAIAERARHVLTGPQSQIDTAIDRLGSFLRSSRDRL